MVAIRLLAAACLLLLCGSCASVPAAHFATARSVALRGGPTLDPLAYYAGHTHSWGVFENRAGEPTRRFTTRTAGHREGATLRMHQTFTFDDGSTQTRDWRFAHTGPHRAEGTANDIVGKATGEFHGNALHLRYTVALNPKAPRLSGVHVNQWLYLQEDGRSLFQHLTIRKFGVVIAQAAEWFTKTD